MKKILACVDNSASSIGVCEYAMHFAKLLDAEIVLLHALEPLSEALPDLAGNLHFDAQAELLEVLLDEEEKKQKKLLKSGKELLEKYKNYCQSKGAKVSTLHLNGDLHDVLNSLENEFKLLILGKIGEDESGKHILNLVEKLHTPIMLANKNFKNIENVLFAYDGSENLDKALAKSLKEPLFSTANRTLLHMNNDATNCEKVLKQGEKIFSDFGIKVSLENLEKESAHDLLEFAKSNDFDVIAMGAYSNSGIKRFFFGSFTNEIIRRSALPLFIFR